MNNFYKDQLYVYSELCIVKEIFNISEPGVVKCFIPALMPFIKEDEPKEVKFRPSKTHLDNDNTDDIEPSGDSYVINYISVRLPNSITDITRDVSIVPYYSNGRFRLYKTDGDFDSVEGNILLQNDLITFPIIPNEDEENVEIEEDDDDKEKQSLKLIEKLGLQKRYFFPLEKYDADNNVLYAKKDQRFIIVFIGGDINNIKIIGRYDECPLQEPTLSPIYSASGVPWTSPTIKLQ